ncbi:MAG TPA: flagellar basal body rod C-terminal domain-containing protein, partial [Pirellulaceae bacterium]|nr:flagellar basal body rod C-terminal domain-containing protein [Pirellulaceae bacterium]
IGVKVANVETEQVEPNYRHDPNHPYAIKSGPKKGYVAYPNINMTAEMVDALVATRAYEANLGAIELSKNMAQQSLRILG